MGREWMIPPAEEKMYFEVKAEIANHEGEVALGFYEFVCFEEDLDERVDAAAEEEFRTDFDHVIEWTIIDRKRLVNVD